MVDVFSQRILAWHAATSKHTDLVLIPVRMATWQRDRDHHPVERGNLVHHNDYAGPCVMPRIIGMACAGRVG